MSAIVTIPTARRPSATYGLGLRRISSEMSSKGMAARPPSEEFIARGCHWRIKNSVESSSECASGSIQAFEKKAPAGELPVPRFDAVVSARRRLEGGPAFGQPPHPTQLLAGRAHQFLAFQDDFLTLGQGVLDETFEVRAAGMVLELFEGLRLDLADAFPRDLEDAARFLERVAVAVAQAVTQADDFPLSVGEALEDVFDLVLEHLLGGRIGWAVLVVVLEEVAEAAVLAFANGRVEADRMLPGLHDPFGLVDSEADGVGQFLHRRLAARLLADLFALGFQGRDALEHVDRDADRARVIGDGPRDGLANPPGRVGRKLVAAAVLVLFDAPHQAGVAFLDQVQKAQAAVAVLFGDRNDETQVAAGELLLRVGPGVEPTADLAAAGAKLIRRFETHLDQLGQLALHAFGVVIPRMAVRAAADLSLQIVDPLGDLMHPLHNRLQPLGAQAEFFAERRYLAAAKLE